MSTARRRTRARRPPQTVAAPPALRRDADRWFREQGLPTFVPLRRWFTDLPRRVAPLLTWVTVAIFLLTGGLTLAVSIALDLSPAADDEEELIGIIVLALLVIALAIAWAAFALVRH